VVDDHQLADEPAHGNPDDMRGADPERAQDAYSIVGHVIELVRGTGVARDGRQQVRFTGRLHLGGQAGVAVVISDHEKAASRELLAKSIVPADQLRTKARDQQKRRSATVANRFVLDFDSVGLQSRHALNRTAGP